MIRGVDFDMLIAGHGRDDGKMWVYMQLSFFLDGRLEL